MLPSEINLERAGETAVTPPRCFVEMFGGLRVQLGGYRTFTRFRTQKTAALFAYLCFFGDRLHSREVLVEKFWPDSAETGRGSLSMALSSLRSQLEPPGVAPQSVLVTDRWNVGINPAALTTDVAQFESLLNQASHTRDPAERASLLTAALDLYKDELLPGFYDDWIVPQQERLAERHRAAQKTHASLMQTGLPASDPRLVRRRQRRITYRRPISLPTPVPSPKPDAPAMHRAPVPDGMALALPLTRFFGRERELSEVALLLQDPSIRLITLTGPGGIGKTRLALAAAQALRSRQQGGHVCFVPLAAVRDASLLPDSILQSIGERTSGAGLREGDPMQSVVAAFSALATTIRPEDRIVLILDNVEQIAAEGASSIESLLRQVPQIVCLVTSRQRLRSPGECEYPVAPLPVPVTVPGVRSLEAPEVLIRESPSVALFVDRAQTARPDFQLNRRNAAMVAALCEKLEGIPLAIELAAARTQLVPLGQMLQHLSKRLDFLVSRQSVKSRDRHRSLRETLEWSYELLTPYQRRLLARLSVFHGGWTLDAAEEVAGFGEEQAAMPPLLDALAELCDASLIRAEVSDVNDSVRFVMLETLRDFAAEHLSPEERAEMEARHALYFERLTQEAEPHLMGATGKEWLDRLAQEQENLRSVMDRALKDLLLPVHADEPIVSSAAQHGLTIAIALPRFWVVRGHVPEGRRRLRALVTALQTRIGTEEATLPDTDRTLLASALNRAGILAMMQGDAAEAVPYYERCLEIRTALGDRRGAAATLNNLAILESGRGDFEQARRWYEESLVVLKELGDMQHCAVVVANLAGIASDAGDQERAAALYHEGVTLARAGGNIHSEAVRLHNLGEVRLKQERYDDAETHYRESLTRALEIEDPLVCSLSLLHLGFIALLRPRKAIRLPHRALPPAQELIRMALEYCRQQGHPPTAYEKSLLDRLDVTLNREAIRPNPLSSNDETDPPSALGAADVLALARLVLNMSSTHENPSLGNLGDIATARAHIP